MDTLFDWRWWLIKKFITLFGIKLTLIYKKKFDSKPAYNNKFLEAKIKSHGDEVTKFFEKKFTRWFLVILA